MSRFHRALWITALPGALAILAGQVAWSQSSPALDAARAACSDELQRFCSNVQPGGGRILACLKEHRDQVSPNCKQAVMRVLQGQAGGAGGAPSGSPTAPAAPGSSSGSGGTVAPAPSPAPVPAPVPGPSGSASSGTKSAAQTDAPAGTSAGTHADAGSARYYQLKLAKATMKNGDQDMTEYTLLVPADWDFKGGFTSNSGDGGCLADFIQVSGLATSGDKAYGMVLMPIATFQYADDPAIRKQMDQRNHLDEQYKMKACPIKAPQHAADFIRENLIWKHMKDKPQVSSEPFPELEQLARARLGLGPQSDASGAGAPRVEAARVRVSTVTDKGVPIDLWWSAVIVVRAQPGAGQGLVYDWHAEMISAFQAPRGQLDGYDKLYRVMATSVRFDPQFQKWSGGMINTLYQTKQKEAQKQSQIIAQFQQHVIDTLNSVTANAQRGSENSAFGADQLVRGVQTFRDPSTGGTVELSNLYDHAWNNGTDRYVMSDDPNFNPNGQLNGNWNELQPVRPQP